MKQAFDLLTKLMAVIGLAGVVWQAAVMFQDKSNKIETNEKILFELKDRNKVDDVFQDSVLNFKSRTEKKLEYLSDQFYILSVSFLALRNSYVEYIKNDSSLKRDEFFKYINGVSFELREVKKDSVRIGIYKK